MKIPVYNKKGKTEDKVKLPESLFDVKINHDLLHQVITSQQSNRRQNSAHSKDRSEKRGGGRKPWRQKGTGRARHGSIRSPIWRNGGVTFGPRNERNYKKKINKKEKRKALFMSLTGKAQNNFLILVKNLSVEKPKTKELDFLSDLPCSGKSTLLITAGIDDDLMLAARNLSDLEVAEARNINALDILSFKYLVTDEKGLKKIKETFL